MNPNARVRIGSYGMLAGALVMLCSYIPANQRQEFVRHRQHEQPTTAELGRAHHEENLEMLCIDGGTAILVSCATLYAGGLVAGGTIRRRQDL